MYVAIIGSADGPTSIFLAGKTGYGWFNVFGFAIVVLMLLPNILYAVKYRGMENRCKNKVMIMIEQIGRYASMFLMIFNIGLAELGFASAEAFIVFLVGNTILLIVYWILWMLYLKKMMLWKSMALAMIPTAIFFISGITSRHYLLVLSAIVFGCGHSYVTYHNAK